MKSFQDWGMLSYFAGGVAALRRGLHRRAGLALQLPAPGPSPSRRAPCCESQPHEPRSYENISQVLAAMETIGPDGGVALYDATKTK